MPSPPGPWRVAICVPELRPLQEAMRGVCDDATYVLQDYVIRGLQARGHRLTFVAPQGLGNDVCTTDIEHPAPARHTWSARPWFELLSKVAWRAQRLVGIPYLNVFSNLRLLDACLQGLPEHDVVYERHGLYRNGVARACKRLGLPYVLFFDADDILESDFMGEPITGILRWRARQAARYNLDAADCVICVSEPTRTRLVVHWGIRRDKIFVFPNAVDVERFRPRPEVRSAVRRALEIDDRPMILFVGNFYPWHDVPILLEAFGQVLRSRPDARLILVGEGSRRQAMVRRATALGLNGAVHFTGLIPHAEVARLMCAADMAVAPYPAMKQELWFSPLKIYEYMGSGTPVVASAAGQLIDVIEDGRNGLLVAPGDAAALAAALCRGLADPGLRSRLGQQARSDAVNRHSWEQYLLRLERLFAAVIAREPVAGV